MPHKLLNGTKIRSVLQQVNRKTVSKCMRGNLFLNPGLTLVMLQNLPKTLATHACTTYINEQCIFS